MTDRVHVKAELELFVDDGAALKQSAFERLKTAWRSDDDFPFEGPDDVPLEVAVESALADALPIEFPGARRSQLSVDAEVRDSDGTDDGKDSGKDDDKDSDDESSSDDDDSDDNGSVDDSHGGSGRDEHA